MIVVLVGTLSALCIYNSLVCLFSCPCYVFLVLVYYVFAETLWRAKDNYHMYEEAVYDITIKVCDNCEHDLMRMYRELREDIADHI